MRTSPEDLVVLTLLGFWVTFCLACGAVVVGWVTVQIIKSLWRWFVWIILASTLVAGGVFLYGIGFLQ